MSSFEDVTKQQKENYAALVRVGVESSCAHVGLAPDRPQTPDDVIKRWQTVYLALGNLTRSQGVILYDQLNKTLNPMTYSRDGLLDVAKMDESDLASMDRPPIMLTSDERSDFSIWLSEGEYPGRFNMEVKEGELQEQNVSHSSRAIHLGFLAIMDSIDLRDSSSMLAQTISELETVPVSVGESRKLRTADPFLSARVRTELTRRPKRGETDEFNEDIQEITFLLDMLRVHTPEGKDKDLVRFWKDRGRSHIDVINLYLFVVNRAQEVNQSPGAHFDIEFMDLIDYGRMKDHYALDEDRKNRITNVLTSRLQIDHEKARNIYDSAQTDLDKARLSCVTWVMGHYRTSSYRRIMHPVIREMEDMFRGARITSRDDFAVIIQNSGARIANGLKTGIIDHRKSIGSQDPSDDTAGIFPVYQYDKSVHTEVEAYNRKLNFLLVALKLSTYLFTKDRLD